MRRLLLALFIAITIAGSALFALEVHWRERDYHPALIDSPDLWSLQRANVYPEDAIALVFLGASRTLYSIDRDTVLTRLPGYKPVMLAMDGRYPLATLRDLAADEDFHGVVICDIDGAGFAQPSLEMQKPEVDHYHHAFSPSRATHRLLLSHWQSSALLARSDFGLLRSAVRLWNNEGDPYHPHSWIDRRRFGFVDYTRGDPEAQRRQLRATLKEWGHKQPLIAFDEWWPTVESSHAWVNAIQRRGGKVIFYASPTRGERRDAEEGWFPRADYWDKMTAATPASTLNALDVPALRDFPLPDDSHVDFRQKANYTNAMLDALIERGLIAPKP